MKRSEIILMVLQVPIDFGLLLLAALSAYFLRFSSWATELKPVLFHLTQSEFLGFAIPVALSWIFLFSFLGLYRPDQNRKLAHDLGRIFFGCSTGLAVVALYILFTQQLFDSRFLVAAGWGFAIVYLSFGRIAMRGIKGILYYFNIGKRRVVIIGDGIAAKTIAKIMKDRPLLGYTVIGQFDSFTKQNLKLLESSSPDELIFSTVTTSEKERIAAVQWCNKMHCTFKYSADLFTTLSTNIAIYPLAGIPIIEIKKTRLEGWGSVLKRMFDIILSIAILIVMSPIFFLVSIVILVETGRPVLYKNERIGIQGKKFVVFKFRSMYKEDSTGAQFGDSGKKAEEREKELIKKQSVRIGPIYKIANDPRITPFGRFLRRFSIDELPQFFNVLIGDMSIVGPRPHQPREVENYKDEFPTIFVLKPGITGLAQISGRSDLSFEEEMRLDVLYTEKWSPFLDIIIFLKTPFILFKKRKAL